MGFLLQCTLKKKKKKKILIAGLEIMRAIPGRGIYKWDFHCSVHKKKNPDCRVGDHARNS